MHVQYVFFVEGSRAEVLDWWFDRNGQTMSVSDFFSRTMSDFDFLSQTMSVFDFVRLFWILFGVLFDFVWLCSTLPDIIRLYSTLFDFIGNFLLLPGVSRSVLNYNETRTSFDRFCQIMCQKPQPDQPPIVKENATNLSIVDSYSPGRVIGLMFQSTRPKMLSFRPACLKMAMVWPTWSGIFGSRVEVGDLCCDHCHPNQVCCDHCDSKWIYCYFARPMNFLFDFAWSKEDMLRLCASQIRYIATLRDP